MLVRLPVEPCKRLAEHLELGLAVPLEDSGVVLPQRLRDEVIGNPACTESRRERVTELVEREVVHSRFLERRRPRLLDATQRRRRG